MSSPRPGREFAATRAAEPMRVAALDGLRGIAVLLVLAHHFAQTAGRPDHPLNLFLNGVLLAGWTGVDLFFVLSGFLITGILYDARERANYFRTFFMRRVLRIFPLYYVSLLILVVLLPALLPPDPALQHMRAELPWYWTFLANARVAWAGWSESSYVLHFWTLAVEEQFYIVWPFLVFSLSRTALLRTCVAVVAAALLLRVGLHIAGEATAAYVLTPARFDSLALGGLLALLQRGDGGLMRYRRAMMVAVACALAIILLISAQIGHFDYESLLVGTLGFTALGAFFAGCVGLTMCAETSGGRNRLLRSRPLTFFGRYSYALYVVHPAVIFFWPAALSAVALDERLGLWSAGLFASSVMMLMVSVAISLASWHLLEKHFLGLRRYLPHERAAALAAAHNSGGIQQSG